MGNEGRQWIAGNGNPSPEIVIVGESPAEDELRTGRSFTGNSGRLLDELLKEAGIIRNLCWVTNSCKYYVTPAGKKKIPFHVRAATDGIDLGKCYEELHSEIYNLNPNIVIALGATALYATTGKSNITDYRGSILGGTAGKKVLGTFHPAHILHQTGDYYQKYIIIHDLQRALEESKFKDIRNPSRFIRIAKSSSDLYEFIRRKKPEKGIRFKLSVDIEARDCIPVCIGIAFDKHEALVIPLWNKSGHSTIPDSDLAFLWILLADLLYDEDALIIGQNFKYDQDKIERLGFRIRSLYSDTMLKGYAINPEFPKSQGFNQSIYTKEPHYKNEEMYESTLEALFMGCGRDCCVAYEIDEAMERDLDEVGTRKFYHNFLMKLHESYLRTENIGFNIDPVARDLLIAKYIKWREENAHELWDLTGLYLNSGSPKQVGELLYGAMKLPQRDTTGEEDLTQLLASAKNPRDKRIIELILEDRRVKKTISTYLMALPDYDGRMKTTYFLCLDTGRTSTGQLDPPVRPITELRDYNNKKKKKVIGTAFQTITKHGDIGNDVRTQYIPDKGEVFINIDSSQAEARVVLLLADDEASLEMIDKHDFHALTATWFFGGIESDYSKKVLGYESPIRFAGKTLRHAGHLGASKKRASLELNTQARKYKINFSITEAQADLALKVFHAKTPNIRNVFHKGVQDCLASNRKLIAGLPYGIDSDIGGVRTFYERWNDELFRTAYSYLPQRTVSDNTKAAKLRIEEKLQGIKVIMEAHDSLLFSIPINDVSKVTPILQEEMERPISFKTCSLKRRDLVIPSDVEIGDNYCDFKKYRG